MLHRFRSDAGTTEGHEPELLRDTLRFLRSTNAELVSLDAMVQRLGSPGGFAGPKRPLVAFTIDDGYQDFADVAMPIFHEFDCHATVFVVPGVVDGETWFWWDQIEFILRRSARPSLALEIDGEAFRVTSGVSEALSERLKLVSNAQRLECIQELSRLADVPLPDSAPAEYSVMSWDSMRAAERGGVSFGAHTFTHPILSRCSDAQARHEIAFSVERVNAELNAPSRVFCYPNGRSIDFGDREVGVLQQLNLLGAVSTENGHVTRALVAQPEEAWRWSIPRFPYQDRKGVAARNVLL
jgi:peptidoglycan/xylan/chitin deacetylase (PgdA/CDA1 family)